LEPAAELRRAGLCDAVGGHHKLQVTGKPAGKL